MAGPIRLDRVSNFGPLAHESDALPTALCGPVHLSSNKLVQKMQNGMANSEDPDQTSYMEQPQQGLNCLFRPNYPNTVELQ